MQDFMDYLKYTCKKSPNTLLAYGRDIEAFEEYLKERGEQSLSDCLENDAISYILSLNKSGRSKATINRKISSLRSYYAYEKMNGKRDDNPFDKIKAAKSDKREIDFLSVEEVFALMETPDDSFKGLRDRALLEFMYGTGVRVTEVVRLKFSDMNLKMNFVTCKDAEGESRVVPIGSYAHDALKNYIEKAYAALKGSDPEADDYVFINFRGEPLTRQGIWKILKEYGDKIGEKDRMTPQILRNSFAVHILQNGGDLKTLQELMGFEDMSVGIAYLAVTNIRIKDVFNRTHPRA